MGFFNGHEDSAGYHPPVLHEWLKPKISGNIINGLGETSDRPATPIYHRVDKKRAWFWVNITFLIKQMWDVGPRGQIQFLRRDLRNKKQELINKDTVSQTQTSGSPEEWTARLKAAALAHPMCDDVGITRLHKNLYFDEDLETETHLAKWAVVITRRMEYSELAANLKQEQWWKIPFWKRKWVQTIREVMKVYAESFDAAIEVAAFIRSNGHTAEAIGGAPGSKINILRTAIEAGLGELGKHGSIIHKRYGSSVRFAVVLTDMPLVSDTSADFGADDFCASCQLCTNSCPPGAISDTKQMVRGNLKWYVDFDKCVPYFNDTHACGICLSACPWSRPGVADKLVVKMARKRAAKV
ncbi:MAG: 4Fe-4S dicluster domain-containing protein [Pseudomonadota bacterium]